MNALCAALALLGNQELSEKVLLAAKEATVFVKVDGGDTKRSGTGFLFRRDAETGWILTNAHVVSLEGKPSKVSVVFGSGTRGERVAPAEIMGLDAEADLAALKIGLKSLPQPLDPAARTKARETLGVYFFGFPFGEQLANRGSNPTVTVGRAAVSSLRKDDFDRLKAIQIDGELNPGNSGGPVLDRQGALVGVAVAKVTGTQIGFAIPPEAIDDFLRGRTEAPAFEKTGSLEGVITFRVRSRLIDPLRTIQRSFLVFILRDRLKEEPKADETGRWGALSKESREIALDQGPGESTGTLKLVGDVSRDAVYVTQVRFTRTDGSSGFTLPVYVRADFTLTAPKD